jgi:HKD family nuclease
MFDDAGAAPQPYVYLSFELSGSASYLRTKMIQADGVALVGSENMSETSLTMNREVGALIFESEPAATVAAQDAKAWAAAN